MQLGLAGVGGHGCGQQGVIRFVDPPGWETVAEDLLGLVDRVSINRYCSNVATMLLAAALCCGSQRGKRSNEHGFAMGLCNLCFHFQAGRGRASRDLARERKR